MAKQQNNQKTVQTELAWGISIRQRLWILTLSTFLITLMLIFFLFKLKTSYESASKLIVLHNHTTSQLNEIKTNFYEMREAIHNLTPWASPNQIKNAGEQLQNVNDKFLKNWQQFQQLIDTPKEKEFKTRIERQHELLKQNLATWLDSLPKIKNPTNNQLQFFQNFIINPFKDLFTITDELINFELEYSENQAKEENSFFQDQIVRYVIIAFGAWALILILSLLTSFRISNALKNLRLIIQDLLQGDTRKREVPLYKDEFGEITRGIQTVATNIHRWAEFATQIGDSNFNTQLVALSSNDELGNALIQMQQKLKQVADEDAKRNWIVQGEAHFSEVIRTSDTLEKLAENLINVLPKYLNAHQGAFFTFWEDNLSISLTASYAYSELQKSRTFKLGEGFIGQSIKTKEFIFIQDIPTDYIVLTSGLGEARPKALMVIPLIYNELVHGAIEIASLNTFSDLHIAFAKRLSQIIGAALANLKNKTQTLKLLEEAQNLSHQLQHKQQELMEKNQLMSQTQEKLIASQQELSAQINALNNAAIVSESKPNAEITFVNQQFLETYQFRREDIIGRTYAILNSDFHDNGFFKNLWDTILAGNVWKGEIKNKAKNHQFVWLAMTITPVLNAQKQILKFITVQFDITKQKLQEEQIRLALEESMAQEEELRQNAEEMEAQQEEMKRTQIELIGQISALNNAAIVSESDLQGRIFAVNEAFLNIAKYSREQVIGQNHRILKSGHQADDIFDDLWKTITQGHVWKAELKNRAKDGTYYWITLTITPVLGIDGKPIKYIGVAFDITAQKQQEEQIRTALEISKAQEAELRQTTNELIEAQEEMRKTQVELRGQINALNNAAIVAETDLRGNITTLNEQFVKLSKYSREELIGQNHRMLKSGQHQPAYFAELWKTISEGKVWHGEFCNKAKDGQLYWVHSTITPVLGFDSKPIKYIGVAFDITAQKRQSERIKQALEVAQIHENELRNNAKKMLETQIELRGQINAINNATIVSEIDLNGNLITFNDEFLILTKYTREELKDKPLTFIISDFHTDDFFVQMWAQIQNGKVWSGEICGKAKDNSQFWVASTITPVLNEEAKPIKYINVQFDITKMKVQEFLLKEALDKATKQEEEIRKKQEQMDSIFSNVPGIIYRRLNDETWTLTLINNHIFEVAGFSPVELLYNRKKSLLNLIFEDDLPDVLKHIEKSLEDRQPYSIDYRILTKDKKLKWVRDKGKGLYDDKGNLLYIDGNLLDITIQKELDETLQQALAHSQEQQKLLEEKNIQIQKTQIELEGQISAVNNAALVSVTDQLGNITFVNDEGLKTWEYSLEEVLGKNHRILKSDEHDEQFFSNLWNTIAKGQVWKGEIKNLSKSKQDFWILLTITPVRDENNQILKYIGVAYDITKQKRQALRIKKVLEESQANEEELKKYAQTLESVQNQMLETQVELTGQINALNNAAMVSETDLNANINYVNDEALDIWEYSKDEVIGKKHNIIKSDFHPDEFFKNLNQTIHQGKVWKGEIKNRSKKGNEFWVSITITPVLGIDGKPIKFIGVAFDITAQKVQSQRIKQALTSAQQQEEQYLTQIQNLKQQTQLIQHQCFSFKVETNSMLIQEAHFPDIILPSLPNFINTPVSDWLYDLEWNDNATIETFFQLQPNYQIPCILKSFLIHENGNNFYQVYGLLLPESPFFSHPFTIYANTDGNISFISQEVEQLYHLQNEEWIDRPFVELFTQKFNQEQLHHMLQNLQQKLFWNAILAIQDRYCSVEVIQVQFNPDYYYLILINDIHEIYSEYLQLIEQNQTLKDNLEAIHFSMSEFKNLRFELQQKQEVLWNNIIMAEIDTKGFINHINDHAANLFSLNKDNLFAKKYEIIFPFLDTEDIELIRLEFQQHHSWNGRIRLKNNIELQVFIQPIRSTENQILKYIVFAFKI